MSDNNFKNSLRNFQPNEAPKTKEKLEIEILKKQNAIILSALKGILIELSEHDSYSSLNSDELLHEIKHKLEFIVDKIEAVNIDEDGRGKSVKRGHKKRGRGIR